MLISIGWKIKYFYFIYFIRYTHQSRIKVQAEMRRAGPGPILDKVRYRPEDQSLSQCCRSGMFIPDPNFSIPDPGSKRFRIPDPESGSASKNLSIFIPKNCFYAVGNMIQGVHPGSGS